VKKEQTEALKAVPPSFIWEMKKKTYWSFSQNILELLATAARDLAVEKEGLQVHPVM